MTTDLQNALEQVIKILTSNLVLTNFTPTRPTYLLTDASRLKGLGFALVRLKEVQGKRQVKLVSCGLRRINAAEQGYAIVELECLGIKCAVEKCRYYLLGLPPFYVWTDHCPLEGICKEILDNIRNARCQKWRENLSGYNSSWLNESHIT